MDWKSHIATLRKRGWTLTAIADAVGANVSTVSELARGSSTEPRWALGAAILALPKRPPSGEAPERAA